MNRVLLSLIEYRCKLGHRHRLVSEARGKLGKARSPESENGHA
jgi:hypothetical protein